MAGRKQAGIVARVPRVGPDAGGIRYCTRCGEQIAAGEHWWQVGRPERGGLFVGIHARCEVVPHDDVASAELLERVLAADRERIAGLGERVVALEPLARGKVLELLELALELCEQAEGQA